MHLKDALPWFGGMFNRRSTEENKIVLLELFNFWNHVQIFVFAFCLLTTLEFSVGRFSEVHVAN